MPLLIRTCLRPFHQSVGRSIDRQISKAISRPIADLTAQHDPFIDPSIDPSTLLAFKKLGLETNEVRFPPILVFYTKVNEHPRLRSSSKNLDDPIPPAANHPAAVLAPDDGANAFAAHVPMANDFLRAGALFQRPDAQAGVVPGRDEFAAFGGE